MGMWNRRSEEPETGSADESLDHEFIEDALRVGRGAAWGPPPVPAREELPPRDMPLKDMAPPILPSYDDLDPRSRRPSRDEPADLDPRSRRSPWDEPADLDPRSRRSPWDEPADLDPRSRATFEPSEPRRQAAPAMPANRDLDSLIPPSAPRHAEALTVPPVPVSQALGDAGEADLRAQLAALEEERERERRAAADARAMVKNRYEQASSDLDAAREDISTLVERLARAEDQVGQVADLKSALQAAKAENAALAERLSAAEREALVAIEAAGEWERKLTQADAAAEVARRQAALATGRAASDGGERQRLREMVRDAQAEAKQFEETVIDQADQLEQLRSALLQAEERHARQMDEFIESLRARRFLT